MLGVDNNNNNIVCNKFWLMIIINGFKRVWLKLIFYDRYRIVLFPFSILIFSYLLHHPFLRHCLSLIKSLVIFVVIISRYRLLVVIKRSIHFILNDGFVPCSWHCRIVAQKLKVDRQTNLRDRFNCFPIHCIKSLVHVYI